MKQLKELTIKEFVDYQEMLQMDTPDMFGIFEIFGLNGIDMPFDEFEKNWKKIQNMVLTTKGVFKTYTINGVRYKACLNHLKVSAGQFIDFQSYMKDFKLEEILSVFLIPQSKKFLRWETPKYNTGYDVLEVQDELLNHMTIGDAKELSSFFLISSNQLLKVMKGYSEKRLVKARMKSLKKETSLLG